jgi:hypothetical protein
MRPVSPVEIRSLAVRTKLWLCEPIGEETKRQPAYVFRELHATRLDIRYLDDEKRKVLMPWSKDTNKPINDPRSKLWLEYRD